MSPHILIVDDDPAIRETIVEVLVEEGYSVEAATNGAEGLAAVRRSPPALVLLDMRMPVLDGWGFARALEEAGLRLPIIVMTAAQDASRWAHEIQAVGVLPKPFDLNDLLQAVEETLKHHQPG